MPKLREIQILVGMLLFLLVGCAYGQEPLRVSADDDFPPFSYMDGAKQVGIDLEILTRAAELAEVKIEIAFRPFKRLLAELEKGRTDLGFSLFKTESRLVFARYLTTPLHHSTFKIFTKVDRGFAYNDIRSLYGKIIGINLGFSVNEEFDKAVAEGKIRTIQSEGALGNIKKLAVGAVDAIVGNFHVISYTLKSSPYRDQIMALEPLLTKAKPAYIVASKKSMKDNPQKKKSVDSIESALAQMQKDGTIERITTAYIK